MTTLLVIEDDEGSARLLMAALRPVADEILVARDGFIGMDLLRQEHPDLIIVDLRLPDRYSGWDVIADARADPHGQHIPIIVTSVEIQPDDRRRAFDAGCDAFFSKPFNIQELRETILRFLGE